MIKHTYIIPAGCMAGHKSDSTELVTSSLKIKNASRNKLLEYHGEEKVKNYDNY